MNANLRTGLYILAVVAIVAVVLYVVASPARAAGRALAGGGDVPAEEPTG